MGSYLPLGSGLAAFAVAFGLGGMLDAGGVNGNGGGFFWLELRSCK
jgi:hypothetical protein